MSELVHVNGWDLIIDDDEPRVRDIDIAEHAGLARPRDIRKVIERNREELEAHGKLVVRATKARINNVPGLREVSEYMLNEAQTIAISARLETSQAMQVRIEIIKTTMMWRRSVKKPTPANIGLDISHGPRIGEETLLRARMKTLCKRAAVLRGKTIQSVHGVIRAEYMVPSVYQVSVLAWPHVERLLEAIMDGRLLIPTAKRRPLRLVARDPRQKEMF